jgi:uncharacterized protein YndB with AHSA1/START domain
MTETNRTSGKARFIFLPDEPVGLIIREFDAPREIVWEAMTKPEYIPRWWGPYRYETVVKEMDFRPGGKWRFLNRTPDGAREYEFFGSYVEVKPIALVVQTFAFGGFPPSRETMVLHEAGKRTRMEVIARYDSIESVNAMIQSGMESGAQETYDRLETLVESLKN